MTHMKKNYGNTAVVTDKNAQVTPGQIEKIAAAGSIVFIKGTTLWEEAHSEGER